jgi:hypothetical protein
LLKWLHRDRPNRVRGQDSSVAVPDVCRLYSNAGSQRIAIGHVGSEVSSSRRTPGPRGGSSSSRTTIQCASSTPLTVCRIPPQLCGWYLRFSAFARHSSRSAAAAFSRAIDSCQKRGRCPRSPTDPDGVLGRRDSQACGRPIVVVGRSRVCHEDVVQILRSSILLGSRFIGPTSPSW